MPGVMADARADRHVPFDEGAEQQVLGSLLIDRDAIFKVVDLLRLDDFYVPRHQRIYGAAQALLERRERIDPLTIQVELARREELDRAGGQAYLRALAEAVPTAIEIERHARAVREHAILRRLLGAATSIAADAYDEPTDIALALDRAEQRVFGLRDESANAQLRHITSSLQSNYEHLTDRMERPFEVAGIPSGFRELDYYTEGFTKGDLVVLAARPSVGKTSLALAIGFNIARRGHPVLLFSLEMDAKQIVSRFLALNSSMDLLALRTGNIIDTEAAAALHGLPRSGGDAGARPAHDQRQRGEEPQRAHGPVPASLRERAGALLLAGTGRGRTADMISARDRERAVKPPPEKPEAEASLLGAMLMDGVIYNEIGRGHLAPADLSREQHRIVLAAIARVAERSEPVGFASVQAELTARGELDAVGGPQFLVGLMQSVPTIAHAGTYAAIVERTALLRRLLGSANEIARLALTREDAGAAVADAQELLFAVSESTLHRDIVPLEYALHRYAEQIDARGDLRVGIRSGLETLDKKTGGLQPNDLVIVAGRPGLGKTSFALNVVAHAAAELRKTCAVFSMEMSELQVVQRLVSMRAEIDGNRLRRGRLSDQEFTAISAASCELQQAPIFIGGWSRLTVTAHLAQSGRLPAGRRHGPL